MKLNGFINKINDFFRRQIDRDTLLDALELLEEDLMEEEEKLPENAPQRNIILKSLESLDEIRLIIDEDEIDEEGLKKEQKKLINFETLSPEKEDKKFILSKPAYEIHPGMKEKLPSQAEQTKESKNFQKYIKSFSMGQIDRDTVLDKLELIEEELLYLEEFSKDNSRLFRDYIVTSLEIIDNVRIIIEDSPSPPAKQLENELNKWISAENKFAGKSVQPEKPALSPPAFQSPFIESKYASPSIKSPLPASQEPQKKPEIKQENFILSKQDFEVHPGMKEKMPVQISEVWESDKDEIKTSPLYNFIKEGKNYLTGKGKLIDFYKVMESSAREIMSLKKELEYQMSLEEEKENINQFASMLENSYSEFLKRDKKDDTSGEDNKKRLRMEEIIDEIVDTFNYIRQTMKKPDARDDLVFFLEDIESLNNEFAELQKYVFAFSVEVNEEKELVKNIIETIKEDDINTGNFMMIKNTSLKFLKGEISEEEYLAPIDEMIAIIEEAKEDYDDDFVIIDGWTLESSVGDKMLREGIQEWTDALDLLYRYPATGNKEDIKNGIQKAYNANKKLIINQKLEEYINEQVKIRGKHKFSYS